MTTPGPQLDFGQTWKRKRQAEDVDYPSRQRLVERGLAALRADSKRSLVFVGPQGVDAGALAREVARQMMARRYTVHEAAPFQIDAGMKHIGQLEQRVENLVTETEKHRILWLAPGFHDAASAGAWEMRPHGLLTLVAPYLVSGRLRMIGNATPTGWAGITRRHPEILEAVDAIEVDPLSSAEAFEAGARWLAKHGGGDVDRDVIREAVLTSEEMLGADQPGPLLRLLRAAINARKDADRESEPIGFTDLQDALGLLTGLPDVIVDQSLPLDPDKLRDRLDEVVVGQREAVEAVVERIMMAKAGLTDPTRPLAVLLFLGPTGTGKTELAKQLAAFLSGSADELVRFDMSEYQGHDAVNRLLGSDSSPLTARGLVAAVTARPASVVLLDEIEKADRSVWDLFLQMFDDARITDLKGNVADFRHAIIVMTSNVGAQIRTSTALGFAAQDKAAPVDRMRALRAYFRPEFLNRIDRIVEFRPLSRAVMRQIVMKELAGLERRRGLRTRPWAIEWDESAVDALLREGFTPDMGARPLKRAIDRHLLVPLARAMVGHGAPQGDQFLFVRAGGDTVIDVQFVDPEAPEDLGPEVRVRRGDHALTPRAIAADPEGAEAEFAVLSEALAELVDAFDGEDISGRKDELAAQMTEPGFWDSDARGPVLGEYERLDRVGAGLSTAVALADRLEHVAGHTGATKLTRLLAERIFLLEEELLAHAAGEPRDAWLVVRAVADGAEEWRARLIRMYREWAENRGMSLTERTRGDGDLVMDVTGFAAFRLLRGETGLHVWEEPAREGKIARQSVLVICAPQLGAVEEIALPARPRVTRRYQERPTPLVKDLTGGWRTGRLGLVLRGNFDVVSALEDETGPRRRR